MKPCTFGRGQILLTRLQHTRLFTCFTCNKIHLHQTPVFHPSGSIESGQSPPDDYRHGKFAGQQRERKIASPHMSKNKDTIMAEMLTVSDEADQQCTEGTHRISSMRDDAVSLLRIEHDLHDELDSTDSSWGMNHSNVLWLQRQLDGICQDNFREEIRRSPAPGPVLGRVLRKADGVSDTNFRRTRCKTAIRDPRMATRGLKLQSALIADGFSGPILVTSSAVSLSSEISRGYKRAVGKQLHDDAERQKFEKQLSDLTSILAQT